jgi:hypothetical protein
VRDTAPAPRRRRPAAKVAPPPISKAELPLWLTEPKKCIAPVDVDDLAQGICGKPVDLAGNQTLTCSTDCGKKLETVGWRRRNKAFYWNHREELLAADSSPPVPCKAPVDVNDLDKGLCGKPSRNRPRPYKTCSTACSKKLKVFNDRQGRKRFRQNHREELLAAEKADRKANPEWYSANWGRFYVRHRKRLLAEKREKRAAAAAVRREAIANGTIIDRRRKLTESQIAEIRKRRKAGEKLSKIAKVFKISESYISHICKQ